MNDATFESATGADELAVVTRPGSLIDSLAGELAELGPAGWRELRAEFAITVAAEAAHIVYTVADRQVRVAAPEPVLELAREQRAHAIWTGAGPWWRLVLQVGASGEVEVEYDYGDEPFPGEHLFRPEAYRADLAAYPRPRVPVWLAAYMHHDGRQSRTARRAAVSARAGRGGRGGIGLTVVDENFPSLPRLWARWAVLAAACAAAGAEPGPRIVPSTGWFESARNGSSGSSLYLLPDGRAVLSGGVWNAPALNAAYNGGVDLPNLYAGAPDWVTNAVLNPRAAVGLLSFCFWWDGTYWYSGESPEVQQCGAALPPIWTASSVVETVVQLLTGEPDLVGRVAVTRLLTAAERGRVTRPLVLEAFGAGHDIGGALRELSAAKLVIAENGAGQSAESSKVPASRYICDHRIAL
ncbi:hypothetical protein [Nocardia sp. NPDC052566]|uniref:hypothetical protein n=1 Tax=Nocardia sp. NPDC052566 TaxID=3364330 RepID=UPI0037C72F83